MSDIKSLSARYFDTNAGDAYLEYEWYHWERETDYPGNLLIDGGSSDYTIQEPYQLIWHNTDLPDKSVINIVSRVYDLDGAYTDTVVKLYIVDSLPLSSIKKLEYDSYY